MTNDKEKKESKKIKQQLELYELLALKTIKLTHAELLELALALKTDKGERGLTTQQQKQLAQLKTSLAKVQKKAPEKGIVDAQEFVQAAAKLLRDYPLTAAQQQAMQTSWGSRIMISMLWAAPLGTVAVGFFGGTLLNVILLAAGFFSGMAYSLYAQRQTHTSFAKEYQTAVLKENILTRLNTQLFEENAERILTQLKDSEGKQLLAKGAIKEEMQAVKDRSKEAKTDIERYQALQVHCENLYRDKDKAAPPAFSQLAEALAKSVTEQPASKPEKDYGWRFWEYPWLTRKVWLETIFMGSAYAASTVFSGGLGLFAGVGGPAAPFILIGIGVVLTLALLAVAIYAEYHEHKNQMLLKKITKQQGLAEAIKGQQEQLQGVIKNFEQGFEPSRKQQVMAVKAPSIDNPQASSAEQPSNPAAEQPAISAQASSEPIPSNDTLQQRVKKSSNL